MRLRWPALATAAATALALVLPSVASAARRPLFAALNGQNEISTTATGAPATATAAAASAP